MTADRGRDASHPLTEVRTVHSRALTALATLQRYQSYGEVGKVDMPYGGPWVDPDMDEMVETLEKVVELLDKWQRTGRPKKP